MTTLSSAPLIEVIFELRWGTITSPLGTQNIQQVTFDNNDRLFPGQFRTVASQNGFNHHEPTNQIPFPSEMLPPFIPTDRFRKNPNEWPCFQTGPGVFTVNQINEGYDWPTFRETVKEGLTFLDQGHPLTLEKLNPVALILKYIDAFALQADQKHIEFIQDSLEMNFAIPETLLNSQNFNNVLEKPSFKFRLTSDALPKSGVAEVSISAGSVNGCESVISNIVIASNKDQLFAKFQKDEILAWLDVAHTLEKELFEKLISPHQMEKYR